MKHADSLTCDDYSSIIICKFLEDRVVKDFTAEYHNT